MTRILRLSITVPVALVAIALGLAFSTSPAEAVSSGRENYYVPEAPTPQSSADGRDLFVQGCSSCHGSEGQGTDIAPPLQGVGAAAVDFYVSSGRMPPANIKGQAQRKEPKYDQQQINAIAAYVQSLGGGPAVPVVDEARGDLQTGFQLYNNNCAACHNSAGSGGAVGRGRWAPNLYDSTPVQVAEAIRVGPGAMPAFGSGVFTDEQVDSIVKYVGHLQTAKEPGGLSIGRTGPVPEGFIGWIVGLGVLLAFARWIGTRV